MKELQNCWATLCVVGPMTLLVVALIIGSLLDRPSSE